MDWSTPGFPVRHQLPNLLKLMSIELVMPSNHLILCRPLLLLPSIFPSIRVFSKESVLHISWPKYWSFSFSISPSKIQDWSPLGWTGWISLQSKGLSRVFSNTTVQEHQFFSAQLSLYLSYLTALLFTYLALLFLFNCFSYFSAFLHLFSSLVIACACSLELREGLGGTSLFKKQEMGTGRGFCTLKGSSFAFMPVPGFLFLFTHLKHWAPTLCSKITICPNVFMSTSKYFLYLFIHSLNILSIHHMY